jgi:hypothetical protein
VAIGSVDSISNPRHTLALGERRLHYVVARNGSTRAGLRRITHGMRHQDAADAHQGAAQARQTFRLHDSMPRLPRSPAYLPSRLGALVV